MYENNLSNISTGTLFSKSMSAVVVTYYNEREWLKEREIDRERENEREIEG